MQVLSLLLFTLTFGASGTCQTINLISNLSGKHVITYDDSIQEHLEITLGIASEINSSKSLEIAFYENDATIVYRFSNVKFHENDTLYLDFFQYYTVDSIYYRSSCLDGTHSELKSSIVEKNKGFKSWNELPDSIAVKINDREFMCKRLVNRPVVIASGNGKKDGKQWGFSQSTFTRELIYSCSSE